MSLNKAMLLGRLGQDPELKYTPAGSAVCNFSLATSETWTDKAGQKQERTEWHRVVVWGKLAELSNQYLKKGSQCFIEGRIRTRSWEDKDGKKAYMTEVEAATVQFLSPPSGTRAPQERSQDRGQQTSHPDQTAFAQNSDASFTADDIPF